MCDCVMCVCVVKDGECEGEGSQYQLRDGTKQRLSGDCLSLRHNSEYVYIMCL